MYWKDCKETDHNIIVDGDDFATQSKYNSVCGCTPSFKDEPVCCDGDCINLSTLVECIKCHPNCRNNRFEKKIYADLEVREATSKGFGLYTKQDLKKGTFLREYVGEVISLDELEKRKRSDHYKRHFYIMQLKARVYIDARMRGSISRFINHSCEPNCTIEIWTVKDRLRVGIFTLKAIEKDTELTFDYQWRPSERPPTKCHCGSEKCRGFLEVLSMDELEESRVRKGRWRSCKEVTTTQHTTSDSAAGTDTIFDSGGKLLPDKLVGKRVKVWWEGNQAYIEADVLEYLQVKNRFKVCYLVDGEVSEENLHNPALDWFWLDENQQEIVIRKKTPVMIVEEEEEPFPLRPPLVQVVPKEVPPTRPELVRVHRESIIVELALARYVHLNYHALSNRKTDLSPARVEEVPVNEVWDLLLAQMAEFYHIDAMRFDTGHGEPGAQQLVLTGDQEQIREAVRGLRKARRNKKQREADSFFSLIRQIRAVQCQTLTIDWRVMPLLDDKKVREDKSNVGFVKRFIDSISSLPKLNREFAPTELLPTAEVSTLLTKKTQSSQTGYGHEEIHPAVPREDQESPCKQWLSTLAGGKVAAAQRRLPSGLSDAVREVLLGHTLGLSTRLNLTPPVTLHALLLVSRYIRFLDASVVRDHISVAGASVLLALKTVDPASSDRDSFNAKSLKRIVKQAYCQVFGREEETVGGDLESFVTRVVQRETLVFQALRGDLFSVQLTPLVEAYFGRLGPHGPPEREKGKNRHGKRDRETEKRVLLEGKEEDPRKKRRKEGITRTGESPESSGCNDIRTQRTHILSLCADAGKVASLIIVHFGQLWSAVPMELVQISLLLVLEVFSLLPRFLDLDEPSQEMGRTAAHASHILRMAEEQLGLSLASVEWCAPLLTFSLDEISKTLAAAVPRVERVFTEVGRRPEYSSRVFLSVQVRKTVARWVSEHGRDKTRSNNFPSSTAGPLPPTNNGHHPLQDRDRHGYGREEVRRSRFSDAAGGHPWRPENGASTRVGESTLGGRGCEQGFPAAVEEWRGEARVEERGEMKRLGLPEGARFRQRLLLPDELTLPQSQSRESLGTVMIEDPKLCVSAGKELFYGYVEGLDSSSDLYCFREWPPLKTIMKEQNRVKGISPLALRELQILQHVHYCAPYHPHSQNQQQRVPGTNSCRFVIEPLGLLSLSADEWRDCPAFLNLSKASRRLHHGDRRAEEDEPEDEELARATAFNRMGLSAGEFQGLKADAVLAVGAGHGASRGRGEGMPMVTRHFLVTRPVCLTLGSVVEAFHLGVQQKGEKEVGCPKEMVMSAVAVDWCRDLLRAAEHLIHCCVNVKWLHLDHVYLNTDGSLVIGNLSGAEFGVNPDLSRQTTGKNQKSQTSIDSNIPKTHWHLIAPEVLLGGRSSPQSTIYAIGSICAVILLGNPIVKCATTDEKQIQYIFKVLGTPQKMGFDNYLDLPLGKHFGRHIFEDGDLTPQNCRSRTRKVIQKMAPPSLLNLYSFKPAATAVNKGFVLKKDGKNGYIISKADTDNGNGKREELESDGGGVLDFLDGVLRLTPYQRTPILDILKLSFLSTRPRHTDPQLGDWLEFKLTCGLSLKQFFTSPHTRIEEVQRLLLKTRSLQDVKLPKDADLAEFQRFEIEMAALREVDQQQLAKAKRKHHLHHLWPNHGSHNLTSQKLREISRTLSHSHGFTPSASQHSAEPLNRVTSPLGLGKSGLGSAGGFGNGEGVSEKEESGEINNPVHCPDCF